ncbi:MAG: FG-GAP-like repeat-containing protein [Thermoplasmatota archaeon]
MLQKKISILIVMLMLTSVFAIAQSTEIEHVTNERGIWTIVEVFPIPRKASGLAYDGTYLYSGIYGTGNGDKVYQIDPSDGSYSLLCSGPQSNAYGLTYDGTYLWTTDHQSPSSTPAFALQFDMNGNEISQFDLPDHYMSGIAYDDGDFWVSTYYNPDGWIYKVDNLGNILKNFSAPDQQPWDLCIENDNLWMVDYYGHAIYQIDTSNGNLIESHPSNGQKPAGVVWDGSYLWYVDDGPGSNVALPDYLYKVDLAGSGTPVINVPINVHDYGTVTIGDSVLWNATVQSIGTGDLTINDVSISGQGADYISCPLTFPITITPGDQIQLPFIYEPLTVGSLNAIATIHSSDPISPEVEITLIGDGIETDPNIYLPVDNFDYGTTRIKSTSRWLMEIQNLGSSILTISDIVSEASQFYIDYTVEYPLDIGVLETVFIPVWFQPDSAGPFDSIISIFSNDPDENPYEVIVEGDAVDTTYPIGEQLWHYTIDTSYDNSPKAITHITDITGDGIDDVIICSEDNYIRCFNGNSHDYADMIWEHHIYSGSIYRQQALSIIKDIDGDGYDDVVVGAAWGARLIRAISGKTGEEIWTHYTNNYGAGGWVYSVDSSYDYNGDGIPDVVASTGDDSNGLGPKRIYCLDGATGFPIWERPVGGPAFSAIGVEDFTGDGIPDVVAGTQNLAQNKGYAYGINGATGVIEWSFATAGSSVWALEQIGDITGNGINDVVIGDFSGNIYGLDVTNGNQEFYTSIGNVIITRIVGLDDVNNDGYPDVLVGHSTSSVVQVLDGKTGEVIWGAPVADQPWNVERIPDITGDGINDVVVGTLYSNNYAYFLDGVDGSVIHSISIGTAVDAISVIPDIVGDYSWEMVVGGRNGQVFCFSGGLDAIEINADFSADITEGYVPLTVQFTDLSTGENPIISWQWDFTGDGIIDSEEQHPSWTYESPGVYTVSLKISDGLVSDTEIKKDYIVVYEAEGLLEIGDVSGGLMSVKAEIINSGDIDIGEVNFSITIDGNFVFLGKNYSDVISEIPVNDTVIVTSKPVFGLGKIAVTISADSFEAPAVSKTVNGFLLFFFVILSK